MELETWSEAVEGVKRNKMPSGVSWRVCDPAASNPFSRQTPFAIQQSTLQTSQMPTWSSSCKTWVYSLVSHLILLPNIPHANPDLSTEDG